jgi:hypothetical protein
MEQLMDDIADRGKEAEWTEVRAARTAINRTSQTLGQRP